MESFISSLITSYQKNISPALGPLCRFEPSCSVYTARAIKKYGLKTGLLLGMRRLIRCHPFAKGGLDPLR